MIQFFWVKWFYVQKKLKALKNTYYTSQKLNGKLMQILRASVKAYAAACRLLSLSFWSYINPHQFMKTKIIELVKYIRMYYSNSKLATVLLCILSIYQKNPQA